jgi:hypothetical protein
VTNCRSAAPPGFHPFRTDEAHRRGRGWDRRYASFQALYADPRGMNLRNEIAQGLMDATSSIPRRSA